MRTATTAAAWLGAACGAALVAWRLYDVGWRTGRARGKEEADNAEWDTGWNQGYDRGWAAARDKAIEFGVQALCD